MIEELRKVIKRIHCPLEVMLTCGEHFRDKKPATKLITRKSCFVSNQRLSADS